jgi:hypothetical protein
MNGESPQNKHDIRYKQKKWSPEHGYFLSSKTSARFISKGRQGPVEVSRAVMVKKKKNQTHSLGRTTKP